jgi:hypothetical protein
MPQITFINDKKFWYDMEEYENKNPANWIWFVSSCVYHIFHIFNRWEIGDFGECSATCGGGIKSRDVKCIQEIAQGPSVLNLPGTYKNIIQLTNTIILKWLLILKDNENQSPVRLAYDGANLIQTMLKSKWNVEKLVPSMIGFS